MAKRRASLLIVKTRFDSSLSRLDPNQATWAFLATTVLFLALHQFKAITVFPADSGGYWGLAGRVAILRFPESFRGYFYPYLLSQARVLSYLIGNMYPYRLLASIMYAFLLTVVVPDFYVRVFGGTLSFLRRLVAPVLVAVLIPGLMIYPLSDLPAIIMLICALYLILLSEETENLRCSAGLMVVAGVLAGGAYNTRTIYIFSMALVMLAVVLWWTRARSMCPRAILIGSLLLGLALVSLPQAVINAKTHGSFSPFVDTSQIGPQSLFGAQLTYGIKVQRYETAIEPIAPIGYLDPVGQRMLSTLGLEKAVFSPTEYVALAAQHPVVFAGILARHAVSGLDLRDGDVYLRQPANPRWAKATLNYVVLFVAAWILFIRARSRRRTVFAPGGGGEASGAKTLVARTDWPVWLAILLMPVVAILPGMIETRFFMPLHLLAYYTIALGSSWAEIKDSWRDHWLLVGILFLVIYALFVIVTGSTLSHRVFTLP